MDEWRELTLGDVLTLQRGFDLPARQRVDGPVPVISSSGVTGHHAVAKANPPGVVIGRYGSLGSVHWVTTPYWPLNTALWVKDFKGNDPRYVSYLLGTIQTDGGAAAAVPGVNRNHLHRLPVRIPSIAVQRRVAAVLAAFDELIAINEQRVKLLEDLAQSLYEDWFVRYRFPGYEDSPLVDSELGPIPETWEVRRLGDVCALARAGGTPSRSEPANWEDGTIPWFKTGELQDRPLTHSAESVSSYARVRLFEPSTILMAIYGSPTVGRLGWLTRISSCNQAALALRAHRPDVEQDWLWYQLKALRARFNAIARGAAQQNISKDTVVETRILVPAPEILSAFAENVSPIRKLWHELTTTNGVCAATRDLLLPRLVTGHLDISDIDLGELLPPEAT